jgi:23S rRNA-/tRNA-specific pseudouridylate synthase
VQEEVTLQEVAGGWQDLAVGRGSRRQETEERLRITSFGSVRVDGENRPVRETVRRIDSEAEGVGSVQVRRPDGAHSYMAALFETEAVDGFAKYSRFPSAGSGGELGAAEEFRVERRHFAFGQQIENRTIVPQLDDIENQNDAVSVDEKLNYIDEQVFGSAFASFSVTEAARPRTVTLDPAVVAARELAMDPDLNTVDRQYFVVPSAPSDLQENILPEYVDEIHKLSEAHIQSSKQQEQPKVHDKNRLEEDVDLGFIDQQFFAPDSPNPLETESTKSSAAKKWFQTDLVGWDETAEKKNLHSSAYDLEASAESSEQLKARMTTLRKEKKATDLQKPVQESVVGVEQQKADQKADKKAAKARKKGEGGRALDYVRRLRRLEAEGAGGREAGGHALGTNLQDRLVAATGLLATSRPSPGPAAGEEEPGGPQVSVKRYCPPDLAGYTTLEMLDLLVSKVLYNDHDVVALWKPYGMAMFAGKGLEGKVEPWRRHLALETHLPDLAARLECEALHEVHRLDASTTGVLLLARTVARRDQLKQLFARRRVEKSYLCITNGAPKAREGVVDIPVGEGKIGARYRMTLRPDYSTSAAVTNKKPTKVERLEAVTDYRTVSSHGSAALLQCDMRTGRKHQIRLHLGLGLGTPVLGDHKFSYPDVLDKPQRVKGDIIDRLRIRGSKARNLPIFLHARRVRVPDLLPGGDLVITANLPHFFSKTLRRLRLKPTDNP